MNKHVLYETGDPGAPDVIKDSNGEVVLGLCKVCNKGEVELSEPCTTNSAFSTGNPKLQVGWDSTSMRNLQFCPRYYQLTNIEGWRGPSIDLDFGVMIATAAETYQKNRLLGMSKWDAALPAVKWLFNETWRDDGSQWGGFYEPMWRCLGETKYKNDKGNAAKCPFSHKGKWFPTPTPTDCGQCGSAVEEQLIYLPDDPHKNRKTLLRTFIWYVDDQPDDLDDGLRPYVFPDGSPAVELSFKLPLPKRSPYGETYVMAGHIDYLATFGSEVYVADNKSTKKALTDKFWQGYSPSVQFDTYDMAANILFPDLEIKGVIGDALQTLIEGSNFGRHVFTKTDNQREEHFNDLLYWIGLAEQFAADDYWPMNKANCWGCPFNGVCSVAPSRRLRILSENFTKGTPWNPMEER